MICECGICGRSELETVWPVYACGMRPTSTPQPPPDPAIQYAGEDHFNRIIGIAAERFLLAQFRASTRFLTLPELAIAGKRERHTEASLREALRRLLNRGVVVRVRKSIAMGGYGKTYLYQVAKHEAI